VDGFPQGGGKPGREREEVRGLRRRGRKAKMRVTASTLWALLTTGPNVIPFREVLGAESRKVPHLDGGMLSARGESELPWNGLLQPGLRPGLGARGVCWSDLTL